MQAIRARVSVCILGAALALGTACASTPVAALDAETGRDVWRLNLGTGIAAGVGSDGETAAVVTQGNELVAIVNGKESWRARLPARTFASPLVAGKRVFVLTADRTVTAFDGQTGARLWSQSRSAEPLVLGQAGVLLAVGDTLVAGLSGRLVGLNPLTGSVRWEAPVATGFACGAFGGEARIALPISSRWQCPSPAQIRVGRAPAPAPGPSVA